MAKYYLTTPIYYANAKPHVGSAYTIIAADVLARWRRQQGDDVWFLAGVAEHGTKIATYAAKANQTPQAFVDEQSEYFKDAWKVLNISYDDFIRTSEPRHKKAVTKFFKKLQDSGKIYEGEYEGLYCVGHEAFMKEGELDANGNCPDHGTKPEKIKEKNWFFKLSEYQDTLRQLIESDGLAIEPASKKKEILSFIDQGLEDISISRRNVEWAIPLPWDASQTIYVWLDELFNYCSAIGYGEDNAKFKSLWPADLHLIGKDIMKFHCIIWPALLLAIGEPLPKKIFAHGYFTVDGKKMSKTLGNVIDPVEVAAQYGADSLRYFILRDIPFGNDGDFSQERLQERYNSDLANGLGNLVSRTLNMIEKFDPTFDGVTPVEPTAVEQTLIQVGAAVEVLSFDSALEAIWKVIAWCDLLIETNKPWELAKKGEAEKLKEVIGQLLSALQGINQQIAPFLPETHEKLTTLLEARPIKKPQEPLFARK